MMFKKFLSAALAGLTAAAMCLTARPAPASALSNDTPGIESGTTYYIKNIDNGKYLDVKNGGDSNGNDVWTYSYNASAAQKWRVVRNSDGSYTLYSVLSTGNRVLDVTGTNVDIWSYNSSYKCQKFDLLRCNDAIYGGTYYIRNTTSTNIPYIYKYVVFDSANNTVNLSSSSNNLKGLWSFEPVAKHDADIYTFYYQDGSILGIPTYFDSRGAASTFINKCSNMGYNPYHFTNCSATSAYNNLKSSDSIWVFAGHGLVTPGSEEPMATICFIDKNGEDNGYITSNYTIVNSYTTDFKAIDSLPSNTLSKLQCVLYMGCSTGVSYNSYNLVSSTYHKGAHFVFGTTVPVGNSVADKWTKKFFEKADTGATIRDCVLHANYYHNIGVPYYEGDVYAKLK